MLRLRLIHARKEMGLTQKQLATQLSVSFQTVSKLETGSRGPSIQLANRLEDLFHIPQRELLEKYE